MKDPFFITSLLIPGPRSPGNEIDVYLQPLIDELIDLWDNGVDTYDAKARETFRLHAALLWTINDFPAYGNLSGWSTKGKMACPSCKEETDSMWLTYSRKHCYMGHRRFLPSDHIWRKKKTIFNGYAEHRDPPMVYSGEDILIQLQDIPDANFGKGIKKRKRTIDEFNWTKKSIFFQLPYWSTIKIRHNLDVMHIEKNICDNILGTLMNISGKTKDHPNARRDLSNLNIRKELHLIQDDTRISMPHACYTLYGVERTGFCNWLRGVKFPDGFASNIARCVSVPDCKISGMKSHDCHIFMQRLLPAAISGYLRQDVRLALTELSTFFKELCARTCKVDVLERLQADIAVILCKFEMVFPPTFFDRYVKNKACPEGSIAEAYIHVECLNFCSMYLHDVETRFNPVERNVDEEDEGVREGLSVFSQKVRPMGFASRHRLDDNIFIKARCEHYMQISEEYPDDVDSMHAAKFPDWFKSHIQSLRADNLGQVSEDLYALACGPDPWGASYSGCITNGIRFHTKNREEHRRTQNSGVMVISEQPGSEKLEFFGRLTDILEIRYMGWRRVYLFKCEWFDISDSKQGIRVEKHFISVNMSRTAYKDDPFVLACQASQVFYLKNCCIRGDWYIVQKVKGRNVYDLPRKPLIEDDASDSSDVDAYQEDNSGDAYVNVHADDIPLQTNMHRPNVEPEQIEVDTSVMQRSNCNQFERGFINDDTSEDSSSHSTEVEGSIEEDSLSEDEMN
ncbi:uncharacterized protein LOC109010287 [Juglans regia]|uniref:Uncharacterized protein LOC109010287 n=1 Tax=Juglans regia TaxID=51240 RepID=A0A2I4GRT3_JUGRE|nr:uncharacterized protein LOC109010287 [Juglans regia]